MTLTAGLMRRAKGAGSLWPNEPAGFTLTDELDFSVAIPTGTGDQSYTGNWGLVQYVASGVTQATDAGAPASPSKIAAFHYPNGFSSSGTEPAKFYLEGQTQRTEIYMGWYFKVSNPWQGHDSGVNKFGFLYTDNGASNSLVPEFFGSGSGPFGVRTALFELGVAQHNSQDWAEANVGDGTISLGVWHYIELYAKYGTNSTSNNGLLKLWLDNTLVTNYTDINYADAGFNAYTIDPVWGGAGGANKGEDDTLSFDHVRISHA